MTVVKCIARCTPTLGQVSAWWARAVESIVMPTGCTAKLPLYMRDGIGGQIAEVRNALVQQARDYSKERLPVSHLHWVDDDVILMPGNVRQLLKTGAVHNRPIVSGVYFTKTSPSEPLVYGEQGRSDPFVPDKVYEVWGCGMGNCVVELSVYEHMLRELDLPMDRWGNPQWYRTTGQDETKFDEEKNTDNYGGTEDFFFLENAAKVGYKPLIDMSANAFGFHYELLFTCQTCGYQINKEGAAYVHMACHDGHRMTKEDLCYPVEQFKQWANGEAIRWPTKDGEIVWRCKDYRPLPKEKPVAVGV